MAPTGLETDRTHPNPNILPYPYSSSHFLSRAVCRTTSSASSHPTDQPNLAVLACMPSSDWQHALPTHTAVLLTTFCLTAQHIQNRGYFPGISFLSLPFLAALLPHLYLLGFFQRSLQPLPVPMPVRRLCDGGPSLPPPNCSLSRAPILLPFPATAPPGASRVHRSRGFHWAAFSTPTPMQSPSFHWTALLCFFGRKAVLQLCAACSGGQGVSWTAARTSACASVDRSAAAGQQTLRGAADDP